MMKLLVLLGIFFLSGTSGQMRSTWPPWARPGQECLTYDGSRVPDCRLFIDPAIKQPYYHEHNTNCSRFWECGPDYEACLFECAACGKDSNPLCQGQWALSFDTRYQYPDGPVCDWPSNIDCTNTPGECDCLPWQTCVGGKCIPQCDQNSDCPDGYECSDCKWCESTNTCSDNSECKHNMCDPPQKPHTTCEYCDATSEGCVPGCPDDTLCPTNYPICGHGGGPHLCGCNGDVDCADDQLCDTASFECIPKPIDMGCDNDNSNCPSEICDVPEPYNKCQYCDDTLCKPGCPDNSKCPENRPICGAQGQTHICGCNEDSDCKSGLLCDKNENECFEPECQENGDCPNGICDVNNTPNYLDCQYCEGFNCRPGCIDNTHCPEGFKCYEHICAPDEGKTLVKSITITSASCTGCTTEGLEVTLNGRQDVVNKVQCKTKVLDHHNVVDYDGGSPAVFDEKVTLGLFSPDGGCLLAPLDGAVSKSTWKWTGEGTWVGTSICVEWMGNDVFASTCSFMAGGTISDCDKNDSPFCA